jgi:hypothetical protein
MLIIALIVASFSRAEISLENTVADSVLLQADFA